LQGFGVIKLEITNDFDSSDVVVTKNQEVVTRIPRLSTVLAETSYVPGDVIRISEVFAIIWLRSVVFECPDGPTTTTTTLPCSAYSLSFLCPSSRCVWDAFNNQCADGAGPAFK